MKKNYGDLPIELEGVPALLRALQLQYESSDVSSLAPRTMNAALYTLASMLDRIIADMDELERNARRERIV